MSNAFTNEVLGPLTDTELRATPVPVSGTVSVTEPVTVDATDLDIRDLTHVSDSVKVGDGTDFLTVNADGSINVNFSQAAGTPSVTLVSVGTSTTTLALASATRKRVLIFNENGTLFVKLGAGASSTSYTKRMTANEFFEFDFSQDAVITAIKASGTSNVLVTEIN